MLKQFKKELAKFQNSGSLFLQGRKGIEKENLRVDKNSALSHSYITKDFAEAMSEKSRRLTILCMNFLSF